MTNYSKKFQPRTRGGYEYEIFAERDGKLLGMIQDVDGWEACDWGLGGHYLTRGKKTAMDLIPIAPEKVEGWVNVWDEGFGCIEPTKDDVQAGWENKNKMLTRRITYTPGTPKTEEELIQIAKEAGYHNRITRNPCFSAAIKAYMEAYVVGRVVDTTSEE